MGNKENLTYEPDYAVPPGDTLQETLEHLGMSQAELADRTGLTLKHINRIIKGKEPITERTAIQFEKVFRVPYSFWVNLENQYRKALAKIEEKARLEKQVKILNDFPTWDLVKLGFLSSTRDKTQKTFELLSFFGVRDIASWKSIWQSSSAAFRKSPVFRQSPESVSSWLRIGELIAQEIQTNPFDSIVFKKVIATIRQELVIKDICKVWSDLESQCSSAGVALVCVPELKKTHLSGASHWLHPHKAIIQLSCRGKSDDLFWFNFFHEAGHVLKHRKSEGFIDDGQKKETKEEQEADKFAADTLVPLKKWNDFLKNTDKFTRASIMDFAQSQNVAPGIIVGRLQFERLLRPNHPHNRLKKFIEDQEVWKLAKIPS